MLASAIDRIEARLAPYAKAISIAGMVWFWLGIAIYARFIRLPELPWLSERAVFWAGVVFNAGWWGWLRPAIESRRKARAASLNAAILAPGSPPAPSSESQPTTTRQPARPDISSK